MIEEAVRELRARLSSRTFRKAIGQSVARYIEELVNFVEEVSRGCMVKVPRSEFEKLIDEYYAVESRIRALVTELVELQGGPGLIERLVRLYPILPPTLREVVSRVIDRALGVDGGVGGQAVSELVREILRSMDEFRVRLVKLLETYSSQACNQSSSGTPSSP